MSTPPPRLRDTDPGFARLAAALEHRKPDPDLIAKVLAIPDGPPPSALPDIAPVRGARSLARWLVVGACTFTLAGIGWTLGHDRAPPPAITHAPDHVTSAVATAATTGDKAGPPTISVDDLPVASEPSTQRQPGLVMPAKPNATKSAASTFHEELALIEAARGALGSGDARTCLQMLDRYDTRFRGGVLAAEAEIARIEALAKLGQTDEARVLADRFLEIHATSPYAERVRSLRAKLGGSRKDPE